jgi:hypothetical protein
MSNVWKTPSARPVSSFAAFAALLLGAAALLMFLASPRAAQAQASDPNPVHPPYMSQVFQLTQAGRGGVPALQFWERTRLGTDAGYAEAQRERSNQLQAEGITPMMEFTRWRGLYENFLDDEGSADQPAREAWGTWSKDNEQYWARGPEGDLFAPWGYPVAWPAPAVRLDDEDAPAGVPNADYGDLIAQKAAQKAAASGTRGVILADGYAGLIRPGAKHVDFNPRTLRDFEERMGVEVNGSSVGERADDIIANHYPAWLDYWAHEWGEWQAEIANAIEDSTGEPALIRNGNDWGPTRGRTVGQDLRIWLEHLEPEQSLFVAEPNAFGPHDPRSVGSGMKITGFTAAYEPDFRVAVRPIMPMKETFDRSELFYSTVDNMMGMLSDEEVQEWGEKYVKYHVLSNTWLGVANRDGTVRRGVQSILRYRGDGGHVPDEIERLINEHRFSAPYGLAAYYSEAVARSFEKEGERWETAADLQARIDENGWPIGYFVSDAALENLKEKNHPAGWAISRPERLPADEREKLEAIAPIYDLSQASRAPGPIRFSGNAGGYAYVDQNGKTILLLYRRDWSAPDAAKEKVTAHFRRIPEGTYAATDLLSGEEFEIDVGPDGEGTLTVPLERWDARMFTSTVPRPKRNSSVEQSR